MTASLATSTPTAGTAARVTKKQRPKYGTHLFLIIMSILWLIPLVWAMLATINRRSRDFNLNEQRQLQIQLRRERLQKAESQPAPAAE